MAILRQFFAAVLFVVVLYPVQSWGIIALRHDLEVEGFFQAQNILRTPMFRDAKFIMQRNTAQLEAKYYFLREGQAFSRFSTGPLEEATLTVIGRGVYDSIYDIGDAFSKKFTHDEKLHRKFEYKLREVYTDMAIPPFALRIGRQQVVWGETDNFRALDVINPLDLRWHWSRESWEDIRIPLWMVRAIYDIGKVGPIEESFVETIWIPWDYQRTKVTTDPRRPWAAIGDGFRTTANTVLIGDEVLDLSVVREDRRPAKALKNGQAGVRFKGIWGGIDFSLNYLYLLSSDTGVKVRNDQSMQIGDTYRLVINTVNPRTNVMGIAANYSEERYTQAVFRVEAALATGVPVRLRGGAPERIDPDNNGFDTAKRSVLMLAFDRPTWIRPLNKIRTFFITSQIFWRRYWDYSRLYRGSPSVLRAIVDEQVLPGRFISVNRDKIDQNELVMTLAASTSYGAGGLWQPLFVFAFDPLSTGAYNRISIDYLFSNHIILRLTQDFYWRVSGHDPGPWSLGDAWGRPRDSRHETIFSIIFQF